MNRAILISAYVLILSNAWAASCSNGSNRPNHHTPKHGLLAQHRRDRTVLPDLAVLNTELAAWAEAINADERQVDWRFTTSDRIKLRHLYAAV